MMLGDRMKKLRKEKKMTQEEIAKRLNIGRSAYGQYEINRHIPEYGTLEKIADFHECSIDYLVGRSNVRAVAELNLELSDDRAQEKRSQFKVVDKKKP